MHLDREGASHHPSTDLVFDRKFCDRSVFFDPVHHLATFGFYGDDASGVLVGNALVRVRVGGNQRSTHRGLEVSFSFRTMAFKASVGRRSKRGRRKTQKCET